jgi:hypothetical protein
LGGASSSRYSAARRHGRSRRTSNLEKDVCRMSESVAELFSRNVLERPHTDEGLN